MHHITAVWKAYFTCQGGVWYRIRFTNVYLHKRLFLDYTAVYSYCVKHVFFYFASSSQVAFGQTLRTVWLCGLMLASRWIRFGKTEQSPGPNPCSVVSAWQLTCLPLFLMLCCLLCVLYAKCMANSKINSEIFNTFDLSLFFGWTQICFPSPCKAIHETVNLTIQ